MAAVYVDTSAVGRVLLGEPDAPAVLRDLAGFDQHVASRLMRIELRRLALREDALEAADRLLDGVALIPLDDAILAASETVPPTTVATLDAIHLATAAASTGRSRCPSASILPRPPRARQRPPLPGELRPGRDRLVQIVPELVTNYARPMRTGRRPVLSGRRPPRGGP